VQIGGAWRLDKLYHWRSYSSGDMRTIAETTSFR
jgi:hypothetical protein